MRSDPRTHLDVHLIEFVGGNRLVFIFDAAMLRFSQASYTIRPNSRSRALSMYCRAILSKASYLHAPNLEQRRAVEHGVTVGAPFVADW